MQTYTITEEDIKNFHNARCYLYNLENKLSELFNEDSRIMSDLKTSTDFFDKSFKRLRKESNNTLDTQINYFSTMQKDQNLKSVFSIFSVNRLSDIATFYESDEKLPSNFILVSGYTDETVKYVSSLPPTYLELWKLADILITDADDTHVFIEGFEKIDDNTVKVVLGS